MGCGTPKRNNRKIVTFFLASTISYISFVDESGEDNMKQQIEGNYSQIKGDILNIVENELERIKNDPDLQHLVQ